MADFPSIEPDLEEIALIANNQVYNSPLTGQAQTASLTGAKWQCTPTFSNRNGKEARDLRAFLFDQEGVSGRFNYYPASIDNIGTHAGGGVVDGAGQTGKSLLTKGWDADQDLLFSVGDYLTVNGEMKMVTADVAVDQDYIEYDETNYMPSPFDPSGWTGANDNNGTITNDNIINSSGEDFFGLATWIAGSGGGWFPMNTSNEISVLSGERVYIALYCKNINDDLSVYFRFGNSSGGYVAGANIKINDGTNIRGDDLNTNFTLLGAGESLIEVEFTATESQGMTALIAPRDSSGQDSPPPDGAKLYVQAAFFGKADDWPAKLRANATIPITPAIRVSPSDENAIEVENPYFTARLETDDMSRLQVSAPVIYNTTLSIVEDF